MAAYARGRRAVRGRRRDRDRDAGRGRRDRRRSRSPTTARSSRPASRCSTALPRPADGGPLRVLVHGPGGTLAGGQFGTALSIAIDSPPARDRAIRVVVPEGRPRFAGSRVSCWELAAAGVPHLLVADAAAPSLIAAGEIDAILVPADRVAANGDVAAAIGTYPLAVVAGPSRRPGRRLRRGERRSTRRPRTGPRSRPATSTPRSSTASRRSSSRRPARRPASRPTTSRPAELVTTWLTADGPRTPPFGRRGGDGPRATA